jgi:uncharacterized membrane protein
VFRFVCLLFAIILFVIAAILAFAGGNWDTFAHLMGLVCIGLGLLALSFISPPSVHL